ncbi:uncharacterized protein [Ptychodera flava]|uniref:uncharacterized protein n=1 Tax=Ptychodera flava TaxID=63121 RepID=UPI00396A357D
MKVLYGLCTMEENFEQMVEVVEMYEDGATLGQKLKGSDFLSKPELPFSRLSDFIMIKEDEKHSLLGSVLDGTLSFTDMCKEATMLKKLEHVQRCFCQLTHCIDGGWDEAVRRFPKEANRDQLERFTGLSYSQGIPEELANYCKRLVLFEKYKGENVSAKFSRDGIHGHAIHTDTLNITCNKIKEHCPGFSGVDLTMVDMSDEWSAEEISRLLVAVKAINHDCQKKNHNVAIICTAWNMGEI